MINLKIDAEKGEGIELAEKYNIRGFPTIVFTNNRGEEIDRIVGYKDPDQFFSELSRIKSGRNTLPTLLTDFQTNPNNFSTLFKLTKKYEAMGDPASATRMINAILKAGVDSSGTAKFFSILYQSREIQKPDGLLEYANNHPESGYLTTALQEAMYFIRRIGKNKQLEADVYVRLINSYEEENPGMLNSFSWRMSELKLYLDLALEKVTWAIEQTSDNKQKHMFIDTKAEILWKLNRIDEAILEIEKCTTFDPNNIYYKEQLEKFKGPINT